MTLCVIENPAVAGGSNLFLRNCFTALAMTQVSIGEGNMESLLLALLVLVEIVAIVDTLRVDLPVGKKILWIILILCVPVLGIFLYYLLGRPDTVSPRPSTPSN